MLSYYPVYLDLRRRRCVIFGGGEVAERKIQNLLECQAEVIIISPTVTPGILERLERGELRWESRKYIEGDLTGIFLAIAATDQRAVNAAIATEAAREKVILNVVDDAPLCTFIAPSIVRRGDVTVALSTAGTSPALARKLRESLERSDILEYADLSGVLSSARRELKLRGVNIPPDRWQECIDGDLLTLVKAGKEKQAFDELMRMLLKDEDDDTQLPS